jgi:hypothetical protein
MINFASNIPLASNTADTKKIVRADPKSIPVPTDKENVDPSCLPLEQTIEDAVNNANLYKIRSRNEVHI